MPKTPEQWLEQAAPEKKAGIFKLFLGYAPGVGKTYSMLSEAIRRRLRLGNLPAELLTPGRDPVLRWREQTVTRDQLRSRGSL